MLPECFIKTIARVTVITYMGHILAPIVQAMETVQPYDVNRGHSSFRHPSPPREAALQRSLRHPIEPSSRWDTLFFPFAPDRANAERILTDLSPSSLQPYQYRLSVNMKGSDTDKIKVGLSRKSKSLPDQSFTRLYKASLTQGKLSSFFCEHNPEKEEDNLLALLKGGAIYKYSLKGEPVCFLWSVPGVGTLKVAQDGSVFFDQDPQYSFLSTCDLVIQTTQQLFLQTLNVASLTLQSPTTHIVGPVVTAHLRMNRKVVNEGGVQVKQVVGKGQLTNHGLFKFDGTEENPSILGVRQFINKKSNPIKDAKVEGIHLSITPYNWLFLNYEKTEVDITESLRINPIFAKTTAPVSFLINKGDLRSKIVDLNRQASNDGFWQAHQMTVNEKIFTNKSFGRVNILNSFSSSHASFLNKGSFTSKGLLRGEEGYFTNKGTWEHTGDIHLGPNAHFANNEGGSIRSQGTLVTGGSVVTNRGTWNHKGDITLGLGTSLLTEKSFTSTGAFIVKPGANVRAVNSGSWKHTGHIAWEAVNFQNKGEMVTQGPAKMDQVIFCNTGQWVHQGDLELSTPSGYSFANENKMTSTGAFTAKEGTVIDNRGEWGHLGNILWEAITFQNEGEMASKGSTVMRNDSVFHNRGRWTHHGNLDLRHATLHNHLESHPLIWQDGNFILPANGFVNEGACLWDHMTSSQPLKIHNHAILNIKDSQLTFQDIINEKEIVANNSALTVTSTVQNKGKLTIDQGKFTQQQGTFTNTGQWDHTGDLELGSTELTNKGTMTWQKGKWDIKPRGFSNQGEWFLDQIDCSQPLAIHNQGTLMLAHSTLQFSRLVNDHHLVLSSGEYTVTDILQNNHLLSFQDNHWIFSDDAYKAPHRLLLKGKAIKGYTSAGEIKSVRDFLYDVQALPKALHSQGNISFSPAHWASRSLADLARLHTPGKVIFFTPTITTTRDYEFANIGHLELYVGGPFTALHVFKAPILTLTVNGPLIGGANNAVMGTIAATHGPLTMTAHSINGQFAKMYGKGLTTLTSTKNNITLGAGAWGVDETVKAQYGGGRDYFRVGTSINTHLTPLNDFLMILRNGAYLASDDRIIIKSAQDLNVNFGMILSTKGNHLTASNTIQNLAGLISSYGATRIEALTYNHTRQGALHKNLEAFSHYIEFPGSGRAILESLGDIEIFVKKDVYNLASSMLSQGSIFINGVPLIQKNKPTTAHPANYQEDSVSYYNIWLHHHCAGGWYHDHILTEMPVLQSAGVIQINMGKVRITGTMNALGLMAHATDMVVRSPNGSAIVTPAQTALLNFTQFAESQTKSNGFYTLQNGCITPAFPLGTPHSFNPDVPVIGPHRPTNPSLIINPLGSLSSDCLNLLMQSALSQVIGKVHLKGSQGKSLIQHLEDQGVKHRQKTGDAVMTLEQAKALTDAMLLYKFEPVGNLYRQILYATLPSDEFNDVAGLSGNDGHIQSEGDLTIENTEVIFEDNLSLAAGKKLMAQTTPTRIMTANGFQDVVSLKTKLIAKKGLLEAIGTTGYDQIGVDVYGGQGFGVGCTEGSANIVPTIVRGEDNFTNYEDGSLFGEDKVETIKITREGIEPSSLVAGNGKGRIICGNAKDHESSLIAAHVAAPHIIFEGNRSKTNAFIAKRTEEKSAEEEGFWSSKSQYSFAEAVDGVTPTTIVSKATSLNTKEGVYSGTDFVGDILYDNTGRGARFKPTLGRMHYEQGVVQTTALSNTDMGCKGWYEVMQPCRFAVNQIILSLDDGQIELESVDWDKNRTKIIGKFAETTYQLKKNHVERKIHEQLIPNEALAVVAFAITIATQGTGGALFSSLVSNATSGSMVATATGMSMASAAFTTLCTQAATSFLNHGDILQTGKDLFSSQGLRSLGTAVATAGLIGDGGSMAKLSFGQRLAVNGFRSLVKAGVSSAIERRNFGETLKDAGINTLVDSISGALAKSIGEAAAAKGNPLRYGEHKAAHFGVGALAGSILDRDHPLAGAIKGGIGAMMAEVIAESLVDRQHLQQEVIQELGLEEGHALNQEDKALYEAAYREKLHPAMNTAKLVVASVMASFGHDPSVAMTTATNALENNFLPTAIALAFEAYPVVVAGLGMGAATAAAVKAKQEIDNSLSGKNSMDMAPEGTQWIDEGFTAAEQRPTVYSTPIPDYELPNEGYAPWIGNLPTLEEYDLPSGLVDMSILNLEMTESGRFYGTDRELKKIRAKDSHHIIQDATVREIPGYNKRNAPAMQLKGPAWLSGTEHNIATSVQTQAGGGTYGAERRIGYKALRKAGISKEEAREQIVISDKFFESLGVNKDTILRIPVNRRDNK